MHLLDNSNAFSKIAKIFSRKWFGEDVSKLFSCLTKCNWISPFSCASRIKWYVMEICFDLSWLAGFLAIAIANLLSQYKTVPLFYFSPMSSNFLLSQIAWKVVLVAETYSTSAVDWATRLCFFDNQEQILDSNKKA